MNKLLTHSYFKCALLFIVVVFMDQLSKDLSRGLSSTVFNDGIIFGLYGDLPPFIRVSVISSFYGLIFFFYLVLMYMLPIRSAQLMYSITLFVAGVGGNVYSKVFYASTIDFIPVSFLGHLITFNLADIFQWLGFILVMILAFFSKQIWYDDEKRGSYLVHKKVQFAFSIKLCLISLSCSLFLGIFSYSFLRIIFSELAMAGLSDSINMFLVTFIFLSIIFSTIVFIAGIIISHRVAGPFVAFESYVERILSGSRERFILREADQFKDLEKVADKLLDLVDQK